LLLSAFVYAEVYRLEADDDAYDSPLYVVEIDILWWKGAKPGKRGGPGCLYSQTRFISGSPAS